MSDYITPAEYRLLGRIYASEIEGALSRSPRMYQTKGKKLIGRLEELGLVRHVTEVFHGVTIEGWELTLNGNFTYCMNCGDEDVD